MATRGTEGAPPAYPRTCLRTQPACVFVVDCQQVHHVVCCLQTACSASAALAPTPFPNLTTAHNRTPSQTARHAAMRTFLPAWQAWSSIQHPRSPTREHCSGCWQRRSLPAGAAQPCPVGALRGLAGGWGGEAGVGRASAGMRPFVHVRNATPCRRPVCIVRPAAAAGLGRCFTALVSPLSSIHDSLLRRRAGAAAGRPPRRAFLGQHAAPALGATAAVSVQVSRAALQWVRCCLVCCAGRRAGRCADRCAGSVSHLSAVLLIPSRPAFNPCSKDDHLCDGAKLSELVAAKRAAGQRVTARCWQRSGHVAHFRHHREEYTALLLGFLESAAAEPAAGSNDGRGCEVEQGGNNGARAAAASRPRSRL